MESLGSGSERACRVKNVFRSAVRGLLGANGSRVLEFHMARILEEDPYEVLYRDPRKFCEGLRSFFGNGTTAFLRILASSLLKTQRITGVTVDEVVKLMNDGGAEAREALFEIVCGREEVKK